MSAASRTSARISAFARIRSWPRVYGTTQKLQYSLQPSMIVTQARTGSSRRVTPNGKATLSWAPRSTCVTCVRSACSTSIGSIRTRRVPSTTSTIVERLSSEVPSCWATQPVTATSGSRPVSAAWTRSSPSRVYSLSSACSRTLQVLMTTTSASLSSGVRS